jgi:hypothetical protein
VLHTTPPKVFDVDSFSITVIAFGDIDIKIKITGKTSSGAARGPYELKMKGDMTTQVKGLGGKGFWSLKEFQLQAFKMDGSSVGYVIDDFKCKTYECSY